MCENDRKNIVSVSYTHLDVYKRQAVGGMVGLIFTLFIFVLSWIIYYPFFKVYDLSLIHISTTIRRDFSFLGNLGKQGYGYDVNKLIEIFNQQLGMDFDEKIILVGAGNMGRALMKYNKWDYVVGEIACAFDINRCV